VVGTVLADTYTLLAKRQEMLEAITEIKNRCRAVNDLLRIFYRDAITSWGGVMSSQMYSLRSTITMLQTSEDLS